MINLPKIAAAVFRPGQSSASMETLNIVDIRDQDVLVKLVATGICHTDLVCRDGFMPLPRPIVLGHEGAGIVQRVGSAVTGVSPGDKVVLSFMSCGDCPNCHRGMVSYCHQFVPANFSGRRLDGSSALSDGVAAVSGHFFGQSSFASHCVAHQRNTVKVRDDAPLELIAPLGCGVQTGAGSVINILKPRAGDAIAIFGAGAVGLSAVMAARLIGCAPIIVIEPHASRRALALEVGATDALDPVSCADVVGDLAARTGGNLLHAIDTSGSPAVITQAIAALSAHGQIAIVSANGMDAVLPLSLMQVAIRGLSLHGVSMGSATPHRFIPYLVELVMTGQFPLGKMVRHYDFTDIDQAFDDHARGLVVKPILLMPASLGTGDAIERNQP